MSEAEQQTQSSEQGEPETQEHADSAAINGNDGSSSDAGVGAANSGAAQHSAPIDPMSVKTIPGQYGEELTVSHALYSRGQAQASPNRPLFICMHGYGSNEEDFAGIMRYVAPHNDYVCLRAPLVLDEDQRGFAWLHAAIPQGEHRDRDAYAAAAAVDKWVAEHIPVERDVVLLGFSQGALVTSHLLRVHPERYRAAIVLSGFVAQGEVEGTAPADDRVSALNIPVFVGYGHRDQVVPRYELISAAAWLEEHTWLTMKHYHTLDHSVSLQEFGDLRTWLQMNNVAPGIL